MGLAHTPPTAEEIADLLGQLPPPGLLRDLFDDPDGVGRQWLEAVGEVGSQFLQHTASFLVEVDPAQTDDLLFEWERAYGIPDDCSELGATTQERRDALVLKITSLGGQSPAYFIDIAEQLGHAGATITEHQHSRCGMACGDPIYGRAWGATWILTTPENVTFTRMTCGDPCGTALVTREVTPLECILERLKPAHTHLILIYGNTP